MNCMQCNKKTVGEKLCPKCQKTYKVVQCDYCKEDMVRDKKSPSIVFVCEDSKCKDNYDARIKAELMGAVFEYKI